MGVKLNHNRVAGNQAKLHPRTGAGDIAGAPTAAAFFSMHQRSRWRHKPHSSGASEWTTYKHRATPPLLRVRRGERVHITPTPPHPAHPAPPRLAAAALIRDLDFVSVSAYQSIALAPKPEDLQRNLQNVQNEIRAYGASIV